MEPPLSFCLCRRRRQRGGTGSGAASAAAAVTSRDSGNGLAPADCGRRGGASGVNADDGVGGIGCGAADPRAAVPDTHFAGGRSLSASLSTTLGLSCQTKESPGVSSADSRATGAAIGRHPPAGTSWQESRSEVGALGAVADKSANTVGYPMVSFRVLSCSSWTQALGRRPFVHACLGRNVYLVWASPRGEVPLSLADFRDKGPSCVRLGRESGTLRVATLSDVGCAAASDYHRLSDRLLFVGGEEQSATPGGGSFSVFELVLVAPSAEVCRAWAAAGASLVLPWPLLFSLGHAKRDSPAAAAQSLVGSTDLLPLGTSKRGVVVAALGARGRRAILQASHWLQPLMDDRAGGGGGGGALAAALDAADHISGVPVAGPVLCVALLVVQSTALAVLADDELRVAVLKRAADLACRLVSLVDEALAREPTPFASAQGVSYCAAGGRHGGGGASTADCRAHRPTPRATLRPVRRLIAGGAPARPPHWPAASSRRARRAQPRWAWRVAYHPCRAGGAGGGGGGGGVQRRSAEKRRASRCDRKWARGRDEEKRHHFPHARNAHTPVLPMSAQPQARDQRSPAERAVANKPGFARLWASSPYGPPLQRIILEGFRNF